MKNNSTVGEIILSLLLLALAILFCNPFQALWMPTMFMSSVVFIFLVCFVVFAAFVWKEQARDEREEEHRLRAGRVGFLIGIGLLVVGIVWQTLEHRLDSWLLIVLAAMVLAKLGALLYSQIKK